jgi:hypothetical protein
MKYFLWTLFYKALFATGTLTRYCLSKMLGSLALVVDLGVATIAHVLLALLTVDDWKSVLALLAIRDKCQNIHDLIMTLKLRSAMRWSWNRKLLVLRSRLYTCDSLTQWFRLIGLRRRSRSFIFVFRMCYCSFAYMSSTFGGARMRCSMRRSRGSLYRVVSAHRSLSRNSRHGT